MKIPKCILTSDQINDLTKGKSVKVKINKKEYLIVPEHGHDSLLETLDRAEKIVSKWPPWKRNALGTLYMPKRR